MYTKQQLLSSIRSETAILQHLATQVPAGQLDYRPTAGQRSTLELLRYLTIAITAPARFAIERRWDWEQLVAESQRLGLADMGAALDRQFRGFVRLLKPYDERKLLKLTTKDWGGKTVRLNEALIQWVFKPIVAYRMQLFLYLKASGATHLKSSDCWDAPAQKKGAQA